MNMTEIEAVNTILEQMGEQSINTIDTDRFSESNIAYKNLIAESKQIQSKGWFFNSDYDTQLSIDTNSKIPVPSNTLRIDTSDGILVTARGGYIYNLSDKTYEFETSPSFNIVVYLDFEELPYEAQTYITVKAARKTTTNLIGSQTLFNLNRQDEEDSRVQLQDLEISSQKHNLYNNSDIRSMLQR